MSQGFARGTFKENHGFFYCFIAFELKWTWNILPHICFEMRISISPLLLERLGRSPAEPYILLLLHFEFYCLKLVQAARANTSLLKKSLQMIPPFSGWTSSSNILHKHWYFPHIGSAILHHPTVITMFFCDQCHTRLNCFSETKSPANMLCPSSCSMKPKPLPVTSNVMGQAKLPQLSMCKWGQHRFWKSPRGTTQKPQIHRLISLCSHACSAQSEGHTPVLLSVKPYKDKANGTTTRHAGFASITGKEPSKWRNWRMCSLASRG